MGSGASLIDTVRGTTCSGAAEAGVGAGFVALPLMTAQPPSVAANDAAVINTFTPGALVTGFLVDLVMIVAVIVFVFATGRRRL